MSEWKQGLPEKSGFYWFAPHKLKKVVEPCKVLLGDRPGGRKLVRVFQGWTRSANPERANNPPPDRFAEIDIEGLREFHIEDPFITTGYFHPIEQPEPPK